MVTQKASVPVCQKCHLEHLLANPGFKRHSKSVGSYMPEAKCGALIDQSWPPPISEISNSCFSCRFLYAKSAIWNTFWSTLPLPCGKFSRSFKRHRFSYATNGIWNTFWSILVLSIREVFVVLQTHRFLYARIVIWSTFWSTLASVC